MNMEARGVYITLMCYDWNEKGISTDQEVLKELCQKPKNWNRIWKKVGKCFREKNGRLYNPRLEEERRKQKKWREKSRLGGKKSAKTRRRKSQPKGGSRVVEPNPNSSSSSSSSSTKKKKKIIKKRKVFTAAQLQKFKEEFDKLWKAWPKEGRFDSKYCLMKFMALCKQGKLKLFKKVTNGYLQFLEHKRVHENFPQKAKHLKTWLNNWEGERESYENFKYEGKL